MSKGLKEVLISQACNKEFEISYLEYSMLSSLELSIILSLLKGSVPYKFNYYKYLYNSSLSYFI
jgi:hypothetical protein